MSMYKGPYLFDFIGATVRWLWIVAVYPKRRYEKDLFKKVLTGGRALGDEPWQTFFLNFIVGVLVVGLLCVAIVYVKFSWIE
jgi:hypothetical protein